MDATVWSGGKGKAIGWRPTGCNSTADCNSLVERVQVLKHTLKVRSKDPCVGVWACLGTSHIQKYILSLMPLALENPLNETNDERNCYGCFLVAQQFVYIAIASFFLCTGRVAGLPGIPQK